MEATSHPFTPQSYLNAQENATQATKNYLSSLHSTRKQPSKPLKRPATTTYASSPLKPMNTQVYRVKPVDFKELVQRLTGAPEKYEVVSKQVKSLEGSSSSPSFAFDLSSSSWGDFSFQNSANLSR